MPYCLATRLFAPIHCRNSRAIGYLGCLFSVFLLTPAARAQYHFDAWTTADGLPQNSVLALRQTRDGYLWMTTGDGVARFDGVRFTFFNKSNTPGLQSNSFTAFTLWEDRQGALWMGTADAGLLRYRDGIFTAFTTREGLPNNHVIRIDEDAAGALWIFTRGGLATWKDERLQQVAPAPGSPFNDHLTTPERMGVDGTFFGLWRFEGRELWRFAYGQWTRIPLPFDARRLHVSSIVEDSQRRLWFSTLDGHDYYCVKDGRLTIFRGLAVDEQFICYQDRQGRLLLTDHKGRTRFWKDGKYSPVTGLQTGFIFRAWEDREGTLWVGTSDAGLYRLRDQVISLHRHPRGPEWNRLRPLLQDRAGEVWGGGVGLTRLREGRFENIFRVSREYAYENMISALYEDRDGTLWVGTWRGLARFKDGRWYEEPELSARIQTRLFAIRRDRQGDLWFGGEGGLYRLHGDKLTHYTAAEGVPEAEVYIIEEGRDGDLWIASGAGLLRAVSGRITALTTSDGLSSNYIAALYEDAEGTLWIGTHDGGLNRLKGGRIVSYTTAHGLYSNGVFQILEDNLGFFWMGSNRGLHRVRKQELNDFADGKTSVLTATHFDQRDGLVNSEFSGLGQPSGFRARDGKLWIPTNSGVAVVDPAAVRLNPALPPVYIEAASLDRQPIDLRRGLRIAPGQENLEIHFTALSLIKSEQLRFRYRMEGLDQAWVEAGTRRTAYYSHVAPGEYVFKVIAANSAGVWNTEGQSLSVVALPPFYQTWWFLTLAALTVGGLLLFGHKYRVAQLEKARAAQEAFSRQLIATQESERKRIASELHDSLSQNLVIIKNRAMISLQERDDHEQAFEQIEEIAAAADHLLAEVREIAHNLRPFQIDRLGLTKAIEAVIRKANTNELACTARLDKIDSLLPPESEINLYRIIQEGINNIVKHAQATQASVTIKRYEQAIEVTIQDNGRGFTPGAAPPPEDQSRNGTGLGLVGIAERGRILDCLPVIESAPGQGTTISLRVRLSKVKG